MNRQTFTAGQYRNFLKIGGVLIACILLIHISGCAITSSASRMDTSLKATTDASMLITFRSNVQKTDFYVDDKFIAKGKMVDVLVNTKPHTLKARPEGYNEKENYIQPPYSPGSVYSFYFMIEDANEGKEKLVDFKVIGYSYGKKKNLKDDYNEALVDAKIKAIERAGVKVDNITVVKDFVIKSDMVEAQSKGTIEPGYEIIEVGYDEGGVYKILMIGKVRTKVK